MTKPFLLAICGVKNSGKTTLIERLIPQLISRGLVTGTIKKDGHSFTPDTPGKDSHRFFQAGACASAIFDGEKYAVSRRLVVDESFLIEQMPEAELIILEGFKETEHVKIELIRAGNSEKPASNPVNRVAFVSDLELETKLPVFGLNDVSGLADFITAAVRKGAF